MEGIAVYHNPLSDIGGDRLKEMDKICKMEAEEVRYAKQLRSDNMQKDQRADSVYCYCRQPKFGNIVRFTHKALYKRLGYVNFTLFNPNVPELASD